MNSIALDIGGANLKISDGQVSRSMPFPLWKNPEHLPAALGELLQHYPVPRSLGVTMTGELADSFASKPEGVERILAGVQAVAGEAVIRVWQTGGEFVSLEEARELAPLVAGANWHALATWAGRAAPSGYALLVDMGSTTTDLIPLMDGLPATTGLTDPERLASGELVYLGAGRTPLCSLVQTLPLRGEPAGIAREVFATMLDVELLRGRRSEDPANCDTADGRPATRYYSRQRMARMLCADASEFTEEETSQLAETVEAAALELLNEGLRRVLDNMPTTPQLLITSGAGEQLAMLAANQIAPLNAIPRLSLSTLLGPEHSQAACAYALAVLARERG